MTARVRLPLLAVLALAQLVAAGSSIARYERTLRSGVVYRFLAEPVDPEDVFRGRYLQLGFAASRQVMSRPGNDPTALVYARLGVDTQGLAVVQGLQAERPEQGDYLAVRTRWASSDGVGVELFFDRYFLEESKALEAERLYRDAAQRSQAVVAVRVLDGLGVIEDLYVDGVPLRERLAGPVQTPVP